MTEQRVTTLPATGSLGIVYIVEPGVASYIWDGSDYVSYEQYAVSAPYTAVLKDITGFRDTKILV